MGKIKKLTKKVELLKASIKELNNYTDKYKLLSYKLDILNTRQPYAKESKLSTLERIVENELK